MFDCRFVKTDEQDKKLLIKLFDSTVPLIWYGEQRAKNNQRTIWPTARTLSISEVIQEMDSLVQPGMLYESTVEVEYNRVMTLKLHVLEQGGRQIRVIYIAQTAVEADETFGFRNKAVWKYVLASGP